MFCYISCSISIALIIGMIYFHFATMNSDTVKKYKSTLPNDMQKIYEKICNERLQIYYVGFAIGLLFSFVIIYYNYYIRKQKLTNNNVICLVIVVSFFTNYFYYILTPKSKYMLENLKNTEQINNWLSMYKEMQYNYHFGMVLGIFAVGIFASSFRCKN